jgi:DNA-3-methyladenine glycosylase I
MSGAGLIDSSAGRATCWWHGGIPEYEAYHDREWGRPVADDRRLFEKLCLEGFQAGLSWLTILRKHESFRHAFAGFDIDAVAAFGAGDVERLVADAGIVRHRGKIESTINNARRAQDLRGEFGSLAAYFWGFEPAAAARPGRIDRPGIEAMATTPESVAPSKDLRKRGWTFVGATTVYAFMQAMGLVNDHMSGCWCRGEVEAERGRFVRPSR